MNLSQYLGLCAVIYLAPRVSSATGWAMAVVCVALSVLAKLAVDA